MITSKQRAFLRKTAAMYDTIFQVGKGGVNDNMTEQVSNALEARELIKLRVLPNSCELTAREAADTLASQLGAEVVAVIGTRFVLYRQSSDPDKRKIDLSVIK